MPEYHDAGLGSLRITFTSDRDFSYTMLRQSEVLRWA